MQVTILSVSDSKVPGKKAGTFYNLLEVAYKTSEGKVQGKKLVSFGASESAYAALKNAEPNTVWEITYEKQGEYTPWTSAVASDGSVPNASAGQQAPKETANSGNKGYASPKSNYETSEERAARQVYIVRQSSLSSAIALLKTEKIQPSVEDVIATAKKFAEFVFSVDTTQAIKNIEDDIPY